MPHSVASALAVGVVGKLGEALLEALLVSRRYERVYVATRYPLTSTLPELQPLPTQQDWQHTSWPQVRDLYCCVDQRPGLYGRDRAYLPAQRAHIPAIAASATAAGVSRFVLLSALAPIEQLSAPQGGLRDEMELALVRGGFETLVVLRPAETGRQPTGHPIERLMHVIGGTLASYLIPQSMQPLRPPLIARAALEAPDRLGPGTHILNATAILELLGMDRPSPLSRRSRS